MGWGADTDREADCRARVAPNASTLTPNTPMAAQSHRVEGRGETPGMPERAAVDGDDEVEGETARLMVVLRKSGSNGNKGFPDYL